ncbi:hypothetical protein EG68_02633 [Paragonimus skrjabini miyazakii]|uniref:N-acyl-aliphatic-L-amino acid amidohydrolase n=1 Tax=Paragonimus skrjabini miyazakii TaxID=59628 RepID=A0A8S9Z262_9TREM|nr:hypothetical protein EG68_02633 [Paragonimus skrjabini miyazakii]
MSPLDDADLDQKALENFRTYLQFITVHPDPDYGPAVEWLQSQAFQLELSCGLTEIVPHNPIVIMCWKGLNPELPAILLNSHMDVVPVNETKWSHPPFGAEMSSDGKIYARGTQDMKCVGIQQLEAVRRLKARGITQLRRTVYLSFVPDEELGGTRGMQPFLAGRQPSSSRFPNDVQFSQLNIGLCLDEGLASPTDDYLAFYDERRQCWFIAHFHGVAGHGLTLLDGTAGEKFQRFLDRIMAFRSSEKARLENSAGQLTLGDVTSVNLTKLNGGVQHNVLPSVLSAWFDVRLTPSLTLDCWKIQLNTWAEEVGGGVEFEFVNTECNSSQVLVSPVDHPDLYWCTLDRVCERFGIIVQKRIFPGATDARYVRHFHTLPSAPAGCKPIMAIGFSPMRHTPVLLHDHDEYLHRDVFLEGCRVYTELLYELSELP